MERTNIVDVIRKNITAQHLLDHTAVVQSGKGRITYRDLFENVQKARNSLKDAGVQHHDRIGLFCEDSIEYIVMALAILDAGGVMVPASPSLSSKELTELVSQIKIKGVVTEKQLPESLTQMSDAKVVLPGNLKLHRMDTPLSYSGDYLSVDAPAFIRFSSGTTGKSKGVLLTHQAIIDRTHAADLRLEITHEDKVGWFLSMSFHFVVTILLFLQKGACIILAQDRFPAGIPSAFENDPPTFLYASPFHYNIMTAQNAVKKELLENVRMAVVTAVSLDRDTDRQFHAKFGFHLSQAYGIIEVGLPFINDRYDDEFVCSVGKKIDWYDLAIEDPDDQGRGCILLKGKGMYHAYISPWKPRKEWFDTGDVGQVKDGYLFISGRTKNVINFAGMKIFPEEVETVLSDHPDIKEAMVLAETHQIYGQIPVAKIVAAASDTPLDMLSIKRHCMVHLDTYKIPKEFVQVDALEKTLSDKIKRH